MKSKVVKKYNPEARIKEITQVISYKWFKIFKKLNPFARMFAAFLSIKKELHFIGITEEDELRFIRKDCV